MSEFETSASGVLDTNPPSGNACCISTAARPEIKGVGPDEPIVSDAKGYRSSKSPYRMDLMPGKALLHMAEIMCEGAKSHGPNNWKNGEVKDHLNKMLVHAFAYLAGDESDDHLGHMAWRAMAALEIKLSGAQVDPAMP